MASPSRRPKESPCEYSGALKLDDRGTVSSPINEIDFLNKAKEGWAGVRERCLDGHATCLKLCISSNDRANKGLNKEADVSLCGMLHKLMIIVMLINLFCGYYKVHGIYMEDVIGRSLRNAHIFISAINLRFCGTGLADIALPCNINPVFLGLSYGILCLSCINLGGDMDWFSWGWVTFLVCDER